MSESDDAMGAPAEPFGDKAGLLAAVIASTPDAIIGLDLDGNVTVWNDAAERLYGFKAAEMIGHPINRVVPPERTEEEARLMESVRQGERLSHFETERLTKDGKVIAVSLAIAPTRDAYGRIVGISKSARSLSLTHLQNRELQQREALLQSILNTVPDALVVTDQDGIVRFFNPAAERMFGYSSDEATGRNVSLLMPPSHATAHDGYMNRYLTTGERRIIGIGRILVGQRKDGTTFPMELQIGEAVIPRACLFTGFVRDLTDRQDRDRRLAELQSELIHVSRLSDLGQMVSALAHEVNQPLTATANYLSGIRRLIGPDSTPALRQALERMAEQAERARGIVQSLRALVKKDAQPRASENLETLIQETAALALVGTVRSVSLDLRISQEAKWVVVEKVQIQQVLLNLMRNAVEAMAGSAVRILAITAERQAERIEITVRDTGPGLAEPVRGRLFEPFVTTKPDGLGVGLSICRTIVQSHGGDLTAADAPGGGTIFRFTVPAAAPGGRASD